MIVSFLIPQLTGRLSPLLGVEGDWVAILPVPQKPRMANQAGHVSSGIQIRTEGHHLH